MFLVVVQPSFGGSLVQSTHLEHVEALQRIEPTRHIFGTGGAFNTMFSAARSHSTAITLSWHCGER